MSSTTPRPRRRDRIKSERGLRREQEILDAAATVFAERGYAAASVEEIADVVGILKGSLYYYIDSKEDLLYRLSKRLHGEALQNLAECDKVDGTALDRIDSFVRLHLRRFGTNLKFIRVFYTEFPNLSGSWHDEILEERKTYEAYFRQLLVDGQAEGLICRRHDPKLMTMAVLTLLNSVYMWFNPGGERTIEDIAASYADFIVNGLRCVTDGSCQCEPGSLEGSTASAATSRARRSS
jgi:AcrR family transcriptional regulator